LNKNNNIIQLKIVEIDEKKPLFKRQNIAERSENHREIKGVE